MNARPFAAPSPRSAASSATSSALVDVAVVGGGIVGAAAALGAAQAGLSVAWVAGRPAAVPVPVASADRDPRVYALAPAAERFLRRLRVWPQLDAACLAPVLDMRVYGDRDGRAALHFDAYEAATERLATIVEHRELARVLDTAAAYASGIERVDGFAAGVVDGGDHVAVATARGERRARLVVAADGAASPIREALGIGTRGQPYGQRAIVGDFACARPHGGTAFQWFVGGGVVALLPLASRDDEPPRMSLVWSAPDALAATLLAEPPAALADRLSALCAARPESAIGPLVAAGPRVDVPLSLQWARRLIASRSALVGDAAHVVHPLAGQGLNLGLADVETLVDVLAARPAFRDCGDPVLLRRYERSRAEPVFAMRKLTDGLARLFASERDGVAAFRAAGMAAIDRAKPAKRWLMRQAAGAVSARS